MGLDMYLSAHQYVGGWKHSDDSERENYAEIAKRVGLPGFLCPGSPHLTVNVCVAYWRKANAIHKWFVDNCQEGEDDCREAYVDREKLIELRDLCNKILNTPTEEFNKVAEELLPPQKGFFFGSTDIDEYYRADLTDTVAQLTPLIEDERFKPFSFIYHSSW